MKTSISKTFKGLLSYLISSALTSPFHWALLIVMIICETGTLILEKKKPFFTAILPSPHLIRLPLVLRSGRPGGPGCARQRLQLREARVVALRQENLARLD